MPWRESVASTPYYKSFMGIFKYMKRAIATWLLEADSESADIDHQENQSAAPTSAGDTLRTAVSRLDRIVPIYSHETGTSFQTGVVIGYVSHDTKRP
ncbi:hypothetical protein ARMGADRAFT_1091683 [Armillaria gallica]|uniref:Uncharacterized protein n=1 Tax=Armillaria gallica TaxID=47427 RepID=A0A2H3CD92_ARMGA|nr:hypothetical protein ARMGADRAFT_1091683 [Armillaria gallica]